jgi:protein-L-isoaspartate(D-aspartate) O-methyltransferase
VRLDTSDRLADESLRRLHGDAAPKGVAAELVALVRAVLDRHGHENVTLVVGDGSRGLPEHAPFDAVNVAAAAGAAVPPALEEQLAPGGRLVVPVEDGDQRLVVVTRTESGLTRTGLERVRFVPLVG